MSYVGCHHWLITLGVVCPYPSLLLLTMMNCVGNMLVLVLTICLLSLLLLGHGIRVFVFTVGVWTINHAEAIRRSDKYWFIDFPLQPSTSDEAAACVSSSSCGGEADADESRPFIRIESGRGKSPACLTDSSLDELRQMQVIDCWSIYWLGGALSFCVIGGDLRQDLVYRIPDIDSSNCSSLSSLHRLTFM